MNDNKLHPFIGDDAINEYLTTYRRSELPPLEISIPLDIFPNKPLSIDYSPQLTWKDPWPFANRAGVYLAYDEFMNLLYIGKAKNFGNRLYHYFGGGSECKLKEVWSTPQRFIINIAVPDSMKFEAAGLEAYLIFKLQPRLNTHGK